MTTKRAGRLLLIDGFSLIHRAFHALPTMTTSAGVHTNAVYGFATMLARLLDDERPDYVVAAFDHPAPTFRHSAYADYKAHRPPMADELSMQIPLTRELLEAYNIAVCELAGYEADDVLGTLARQACEEGCQAVVVTGDKDALQLVEPGVSVLITRRGITEMDCYDQELVRERMGVSPAQLVDWKALVGDKSDNIPGVAGIGEKTATKLLQQYGSLLAILDHAHDIPGKMGANLRTGQAQALLSQQLATIDTSAPVEIDWEAAIWSHPDVERLAGLYEKIESPALLRQLRNRYPESRPAEGPTSSVLPGMEAAPATALRPELEHAVVDKDGWQEAVASLQEPVTALSLSLPGGRWVCSVAGQGKLISAEKGCVDGFVQLLASGRRVWTYDLKAQLVAAARLGIEIPTRANLTRVDDLLLAAYLVNPSEGDHSPSDLALRHGHSGFASLHDGAARTMSEAQLLDALAQHHRLIAELLPEMTGELEKSGMRELYRSVELPLTVVLAQMESSGIAVDRKRLASMSVEMAAEIASLTRRIYAAAGTEFNINSPKQLAVVLFEKLRLPVIKSTKTGPSTAAEVLEELAAEHLLPQLVLDYRQLVKLTGTYVDALPAQISSDTDRVHTTFNQAVTATGRLSSTNPNLQNIPVRTALGRQVRGAFVPGQPGWALISADYSQIELRVLAHLSQDDNLLAAFRSGKDIHSKTAAEVFGVAPEEVTAEMRSAAKAINFGIVYGISSFGLARGTGLSRHEAQAYIDSYFDLYQGVKRYMEETVAQGRAEGYVTTVLGRRRYLPDLSSRRWQLRRLAERTAMNTPIQGSAADIIKLAMLAVAEGLASAGLTTRMLLQVHDELLFEAPPEELNAAVGLIREAMEHAYPLDVPLVVDVAYGPNWLDVLEFADARTS